MNENKLYKTLRITNITENIKGFKIFSFDSDEVLKYKAGQYLTFIHYEHNEEIRRSYSITSSPVLNESLSVGVKRIENGLFSRLLIDTAEIGDEVKTIGAGGIFILPDNFENYEQVFFFAAGSGITPIYSLLKTVLDGYKRVDVVLIYSNASYEKTIFLSELKEIEKKFPGRFHVKFLFSNTIELSKARLHRNLIIDLLKEFSIAEYAQTLFYICGPEAYMRLCTYTLQENDVPKSNIKREDFVINAAKKRDASPPDTTLHTAFIRLNEEMFNFEVHYPDSILQAAKKANVVLPYSCEAGRCASCIAKCLKGKIWHSYNEVLTEKELEDNLVLTCVGHPVNGDVELLIRTI
ncbi:MAG: iron-sulfur cluster-binding domain-containing protein [Parafilimonas sp.]|nr:iron-sulfur cluster-binding domain-containing protein [Parafilimonas sp.]